MAKRGRKLAKIDWSVVDILLEAQCGTNEIAGYFGIDEMTLYRACKRDNKVNFEAYKREKKRTGVAKVKLVNYNNALSGNSAADRIWYLKQYGGQKDKLELTNVENVNINLLVEQLSTEELLRIRNGDLKLLTEKLGNYEREIEE